MTKPNITKCVNVDQNNRIILFIYTLILSITLPIVESYAVSHSKENVSNGAFSPLANDILALPKPIQKSVEISLHGDKRIDPYAWLRDPKWPEIKDPEILNYLAEEKKYTEAFFKPLSEFQEKLYQELKGRIQEEDSTYPINNEDFLYYDRSEKEKEYLIHCRKKVASRKEEIILDENELAKGKPFFKIGVFELSHDQQFLAYSADTSGQERYTVRVKDLKSGKFLSDVLENTSGERIIWHKKLNGFFYIALNDKLRSDCVFFHKVGEPQSKDQLIYHEKDETFSVSLKYSSDRQSLFLETSSSNAQEHHFINIMQHVLTPKVLIPRREGHLYTPDFLNGYFYFLTNDKGCNFRLVKVAADKLGLNEFDEIISHNPSHYLVNFYLYENYLAFKQIEDGVPRIKVKDLTQKNITTEVPLKEEAYDANIDFTRHDSPFLRIKYSSLATPETIFEYHFSTKKLHLRKTQQVLGEFDSRNYQVERFKVPSKDGTMIPISLVYRKSLKKIGGNPLLLYGYGSYGLGVEAKFILPIISLLDRGFIYAIAHVRGGDDLGYQWYEDGKLLKKKHTFEDFIACSESLIEKGYTVKKGIAISGRSAGGILMGYCANERPDLYRAVIAGVPFVDVLNTMLDGDLPLTPGEYKEWGNPKEKQFYHYIKSYSPYENVKAQEYPHMYITGGLNDPRVTYWEPTKWVAKLRENKTDKNVLLLDMNMGAGHSGSSGRFTYLKEENAKHYAFLLHVFDIKNVEVKKGFVETCKYTFQRAIERIRSIF